MSVRKFYPAEMVKKWVKEIADGKVDKEGIIMRTGMNRTELNRLLKRHGTN